MFYIFLYKIKNFLYICFRKNKKQKIKNKEVKKNILFKKESREEFGIKDIDFNEKMLQKNLNPLIKNAVLLQIIIKNKIEVLNNLIKILDFYPFKIKIGIEIEFYSDNIDKDIFKYFNIKNIIDEMGNGQKEIQTNPYTDLNLLVSEYIKIKEILKNADFCAVPKEDDCGSALQVNLSLEQDKKNLFYRNNGEESGLLLNCVAGLLKNINNNLLLYINDASCLKRYDVERNINIRDRGKYPAPTFISWGINNRTAAVRIPTPKDFKDYYNEDNKNRRIEFRVPSSNADIYLVLIGVLTSIVEGIDGDLQPIEKTSFDVLEKNKFLEKIECDFNNLNDIFCINDNILFF